MQSYQRFQHIGHTASTPPAQTPQRSFRGTAAGTHLPSPTGSHTAAHMAKQGRFGWGRYHYPRSVLRGSETLRGRVSERHTLPLCAREECVGKKQRAFWTSTHALCVDVQRRRGPTGTRSPAAGSCTASVSFHGLPSRRRNSGESFHAPCCADSFICALRRSVVLSNAVSCRS